MLKICIVSNKTKKCSSMWQCGALNVPQKSVRCLGMFSLQFPQYAHPDGKSNAIFRLQFRDSDLPYSD
jgi:hypothetical protein